MMETANGSSAAPVRSVPMPNSRAADGILEGKLRKSVVKCGIMSRKERRANYIRRQIQAVKWLRAETRPKAKESIPPSLPYFSTIDEMEYPQECVLTRKRAFWNMRQAGLPTPAHMTLSLHEEEEFQRERELKRKLAFSMMK